MSQLTFTVLTERGRRHVVKVAATDLVQVILNKACQKQGMDPSKYTLKSGRRVLDLNQPVRFSKLANNAKLEVAPGGTGGGAKSSHVMLQTDGGERLSHEFDASASLWDVLSHWNQQRADTGQSLLARTAPDGTPLEPVCQYTQRQFVAEATLRATTLQSLGLAGGRGAVRLSFRAAQNAVGTAQAAQAAPTAQQSTMQGAKTAVEAVMTSPAVSAMEVEPVAVQPGPGPGVEVPVPAALDEVPVSAAMDVESEPVSTAQPVGNAIGGSVSMDTSEDKPCVQPKPQPQLVPPPQQTAQQQPQQEQHPRVHQPQARPAKQTTPHAGRGLFDQVVAQARAVTSAGSRGATAPSAASSSAAAASAAATAVAAPTVEDRSPCNRNAAAFVLDDGGHIMQEAIEEEHSDSFYEVTPNDLHRTLTAVKASRKEGDLMTKAMRERRELAAFQGYESTRIRFYFPNRQVLQGTFRIHEPVSALYDFVAESLATSYKFELYTAPPRTVLTDRALPLVKARLVPQAIVRVGGLNASEAQFLVPALAGSCTTLKRSSSSQDSEDNTAASSPASTGQAATGEDTAPAPDDAGGKKKRTGKPGGLEAKLLKHLMK